MAVSEQDAVRAPPYLTCINYPETPDGDRAVRRAIQGRGADIIVEIGGATLSTSLAAAALEGFVGAAGFVARPEVKIRLRGSILPMVRIQGIAAAVKKKQRGSNQGLEGRTMLLLMIRQAESMA